MFPSREATKIKKLRVAMPLVPKEVGDKGNAIVTSILNDSVVVVTDFGNEIIYTKAEVLDQYLQPSWTLEHMMYYGALKHPEVALRERFTSQIEYLQTQLDKLNAETKTEPD